MSVPFVRALVVVAAVLALFGCERLSDVKRCRTLAQSVNPALDTVEEVTKAGQTPVAYAKAAVQYEAIAKSLDGFDGGTPELGRAVGEYAAVARSSARVSTLLAQAIASSNAVSRQLDQHELERLARQEKAIVRRIDDECTPR